MATTFESCLGPTQPINLLEEYLSIFRGRQKSKAYLLSWLDNWIFKKKRDGQAPWIYVVLQDLADDLGYCRDTVHRHLKDLVEMGLLDRKPYKRWATDNIWQYTINFEEVQKWLLKESCLSSPEVIVGSLNLDCGESEFRLPTVQVQNTYTNYSSLDLSLQKTEVPKPVVIEKKEIEKWKESQSELISREELASLLSELPVKVKPNLNLKKAVESNFPRLSEALKNLKRAMNSWRVHPNFNWGGLLVRFLREEYEWENQPSVDFSEEEDPPTDAEISALADAKVAKLILDYYYSTIERSHRAILLDGRNLPWRQGLALLNDDVRPTPPLFVPDPLFSQPFSPPTLSELVDRKRCLWHDVPSMRSQIHNWVENTDGVVMTDDGPVLDEGFEF
jgi:DNA-binding MarR family transcriptional regulator